jgi:NitT/TauT family transport system substrate-binding protein
VPEGTSGDMILTLALQKAGMTNKDIQRVPMDASTIVSAFSSKQIDAAGFWYPAISTIKKTVPDLVELAKNDDFADKVSFPTAFVAGNNVVAEKAAAVTKVLAGAARGDRLPRRPPRRDDRRSPPKMLKQPVPTP